MCERMVYREKGEVSGDSRHTRCCLDHGMSALFGIVENTKRPAGNKGGRGGGYTFCQNRRGGGKRKNTTQNQDSAIEDKKKLTQHPETSRSQPAQRKARKHKNNTQESFICI